MSRNYILTRSEALSDLTDELGSEKLAEKAIKFFEDNRVDIKNRRDFNFADLNIDEIAKDISNTIEGYLDIGYELRKEIERELRDVFK